MLAALGSYRMPHFLSRKAPKDPLSVWQLTLQSHHFLHKSAQMESYLTIQLWEKHPITLFAIGCKSPVLPVPNERKSTRMRPTEGPSGMCLSQETSTGCHETLSCHCLAICRNFLQSSLNEQVAELNEVAELLLNEESGSGTKRQ